MTEKRTIVLIVYEGFELLDMSGPVSVFHMAGKVCGGYDVRIASTRGGAIEANSGVVVQSTALAEVQPSTRTTVLVVGADDAALAAAQSDAELLAFMRHAGSEAGRYGSVCTGAFITAAAGLLSGRSSTTHWREAERLKAAYPDVMVDAERLYVRDGKLWSSAGISSGIDMALAMVEQDHGRGVMTRVAKRLVLYAHRPGTQAQFSLVLRTQSAVADPFGDVIAWITERMREPITVRDMADQAGMSERTFYRKFTRATEMTPSRFLETLRLEKARSLLEAGAAVKAIPGQVGFLSESGFRAAFEARFKVSPSHYRLMHRGSEVTTTRVATAPADGS